MTPALDDGVTPVAAHVVEGAQAPVRSTHYRNILVGDGKAQIVADLRQLGDVSHALP